MMGIGAIVEIVRKEFYHPALGYPACLFDRQAAAGNVSRAVNSQVAILGSGTRLIDPYWLPSSRSNQWSSPAAITLVSAF